MQLVKLAAEGTASSSTQDMKLFYVCRRKGCQMKRSIYFGTPLNRLRSSLPRTLQGVFLFLANSKAKFIQETLNFSAGAVNNLNKAIITAMDAVYQEENPSPIGGLGKSVQIDETIVVKGHKVKCPSEIQDEEYEDGQWIVGGVEEDDPQRFFVVGVPNRTAETMRRVIMKNVAPGSTVLTDGHRSYPAAISSLNGLLQLDHIIVNHSQGFVGAEGRHTNKIEALWSGMQGQINRRRGLRPAEVDDFLIAFRWRRRYKNDYSSQFFKIVSSLFRQQ